VSVEPDRLECCTAVREQSQTRYLCNEAPMLPLPDCSNPGQCRCKYRHWQDRRQEDRRALKSGIANQYFNGADRRADAERRSR
jgi:hypothetical protein